MDTILDEFVPVSGLHRKHAMRLLRMGRANRRFVCRLGRRQCDDAAREALIVIREASDPRGNFTLGRGA